MELGDFKNKRITVMGIGQHGGGIGTIKFLAANGAKVLATDRKTKEQLEESLEKLKGLPVEYFLGGHRLTDFTDTDMVIKNPAVPEDSEFLAAARDKKIPVENDIGIFFELCPAPIIGVTGTKGKSTTASLIAHLMRQKFSQVVLAGNIRQSVLEKLPEITKNSIVILELSSWQLGDAKNHKKSPYAAVITNILADHLNRYAGLEDYIGDKKLIFKFQRASDYLFLDYTEPRLKAMAKEAKSRVYFYSAKGDELLKDPLPALKQELRIGAYIRGKKIYFGGGGEEICSPNDIRLIGRHNLNNVLAAISVACIYDVPKKKMKLALRDFKSLSGRLELIAEKNGVKYINDTTATDPDAAIAAINAVNEWLSVIKSKAAQAQKPGVILITGGADKNLDFAELGKIIKEKCKAVILLKGTALPKFKKILDPETPLKITDSMQKAVSAAKNMAKAGDAVLLSPACASFGLFKHEFDRGEKFDEAVSSL